MPSRHEREVVRLRAMKAIYDAADGRTKEFVDLWEIREQLGLSDQDMGDAVDYLENERLIEPLKSFTGQQTPMHAQLTHRGLREMEESEKEPEQRTEHFLPLISVVNIGGSMIGSAIQTGSPGATQRVEVGDISVGGETADQVRAFLAEYDAKLYELRQEHTAEAFAEIASDIATVKAQIESPKPKKHIVRECLTSIRTILEVGAGGAATVGLLYLLGQIHL